MGTLKSFVRFYISQRSIVAVLLLLGALEVLFLLRALWPKSFGFVVANHIFEIAVLLSVSQMILLLLRLQERAPRHVCKDEYECAEMIRERVAGDPRAVRLLVFSAGLASRFDLVTTIHRSTPKPFTTSVLVQDPATALDRDDARRLETNLLILKRDHPEIPVEIRTFELPATVRALLLCDAEGAPLWGAASWYRYEQIQPGNVRVVGRRNPAVVFDADTSKGDSTVLQFLADSFDDLWARSADTVAYASQAARVQG